MTNICQKKKNENKTVLTFWFFAENAERKYEETKTRSLFLFYPRSADKINHRFIVFYRAEPHNKEKGRWIYEKR